MKLRWMMKEIGAMTIGTGIAIAAMWMLPIVCAVAPQVSGIGLFIAMFAALIGTLIVLQ